MASTVTATFDGNDLFSGLRKMEQENAAVIASLQKLGDATAFFNKEGELTGATIDGQVDSAKRYKVSLSEVDGQLQKTRVAFRATTNEAARLREQMQFQTSSGNRLTLEKLIDTKSFSPEALKKFQSTLSKIGNLNTNIVTPTEIKEMFRETEMNDGIVAATGTLGRLRDYINKLRALRDQASKQSANPLITQNQAAFKSFTQNELFPRLSAEFGGKEGINENELKTKAKQTVRNALEGIKAQIALDPTVDVARVKKVLDQLKTGKIIDIDDNKLAQQLTRILGIYEKIKDTRARESQLDSDKFQTDSKTAAKLAEDSARANAIQRRVNNMGLNAEQNRLGTIKPELKIQDTARLSTLSRNIAQLAQQAKLTEKDVEAMYKKVQSGDFDAIDGKFTRLTAKIVAYQKELKKQLNNTANDDTFGPKSQNRENLAGGIPSMDGKGLGRLREAAGFFDRIRVSLQYFAMYKGFTTMSDQISQAVSSAREFEIQVSLIRTISQDSQLSTSQWMQQLAQVSTRTGIDLKDVGAAAYDVVSNQIAQGPKVAGYLSSAADLARTTGSSLKDSVNILSSVTNTYGQSAGTVEQVAAKVFKMVDRGRVVTGDLANTFGRVLFTSQELGVSFDEVSASIAMMTRAGVTADDAITLLNNLMLHTAKPSEQMKKYFNELGISVPRDAFRILGGVKGVVDMMNKGIKVGKLNPEDLFPEARTNRAFNFFAGRTDDLQKEMKIIGEESGDTFGKAIAIRAEPYADKLAKVFMGVKNGLNTSIGQSFNRALVGGIEKVSGMDIDEITSSQEKLAEATAKVEFAIGRTARIIVTGVAGWTALKVATTGYMVVAEMIALRNQKNLAIEQLMHASKIRNVQLTYAEAAAELAKSRATAGAGASKLGAAGMFAKANPVLTGLMIGATVLTTYEAYKATAIDTFSSSKEALMDYVAGLEKLKVSEKVTKSLGFLDTLKQKFSDVDKETFKGLTTGLRESNIRLDSLREKGGILGEALKSSFAGYVGLLNKNFSDTESRLSKIKETIDGMKKAGMEFGVSIRDTLFSLQKDYATPMQKGELLQRNISTLSSDAEAAYAKGTPEGVAEGRALYQRIVQEKAELAKLDMEMRKSQMEAAGGGVVLYDPLPLARDLANVAAQKAALEERAEKSMQKQLDVGREQQAVAKSKIKDAEAAFKAFEEFSIYETGTSNPKFKYQNKTGGLDIKKAQEDYDRLASKLSQYVDPNVTDRMGFSKQIAERKENIFAQLKEAEVNKELGKQQTALTETAGKRNKSMEQLVTLTGQASEETAKLNTAMKTNTDELIRLLSIQKGAYNSAEYFAEQGATSGVAARYLGMDTKDDTADTAEGRRKRAEFTEKAKVLQEKLKEIGNRQVATRKTESGVEVPDIIAAGQKLKDFKAALMEYDQLIAARDAQLKAVQNKAGRDNIHDETGAEFKDLSETRKRIRDSQMGTDREYQKLLSTTSAVETQEGLLRILELQVDKQAAVNQATTDGMTAVKDRAQAVIEFANKGADAAERMKKAFAELSMPNGGFVGPPQENGRYAYGGPVGKDQVSAWLQQGEHVMTAAASNRFYSQITAMNNTARRPQYFNNGGSVNGGDVTINVNESQRPMQTGREIARILKRTQRNG
jgi:TP901 family phage tail tape measure protein